MRPQSGKPKILNSAMELFEEKGYFATTISQITVKAGVSKGLFYNYYKNKEELLIDLIDSYTIKIQKVAETLDSLKMADDFLSSFIDNYFSFLKNEKRFLKLQLTLMLMPELQSIVGKAQKRRAGMLLKMVTTRFKEKNIPSPKSKARLLLSMLDGLALHYLFVYDNYPLVSMKPQLIKTIKDLCKI